MFDAELFCSDFTIDTAPRGHRHHRQGWVNITCPSCGSSSGGYHLGINIRDAYATCFKHGYVWLPKLISKLNNVNISQANKIILKYSTGEIAQEYKEIVNRPSKLILPKEFSKLQKPHWDYLKFRNFSPNIGRQYDLMGVGMEGEYAMRLIAPIYQDGLLVSFQGRTILNNKNILRYKACAQKHEVIPHHHVLYGIDQCKSDSIIVVEGITDRWRLGKDCAATFGIEWTSPQGREIANRFKKFFILYDEEDQAQEKALLLYNYLTGRGLDGEIVYLNIANDPASLTDKQAQELKGDLGFFS